MALPLYLLHHKASSINQPCCDPSFSGIRKSRITAPGAVEYYQKTLLLNPDSKTARINLGNVYLAMGKIDEAFLEYEHSLTIDPHIKEARANLGVIYLTKGMTDRAISELKQSLAIDPSFAEAHYTLGNAYFKKNMLDEAISAYKKALATNPNYGKAHGRLCVDYYTMGDYQLAKLHCDKAVTLGEPVNPKLLQSLEAYR